jgi:chaperonin GroES
MQISDLLDSVNIAADLDTNELIKIGNDVAEGFDTDLASRKPWEEDLESWTKLALQISDKKTFPWNGAANIKYPLLATAAMQFAARAYPTLVPSDNKVVKCRVIGSDPTGEKTNRAKRVSTHMSYQLLEEMDDWEEDMDRLLISVPIAGTCFKKTYWDAGKLKNCSKLVLPKFLVVNNDTKNIDDAERISEVIYLSKRKVKERQNEGIFLDVELPEPSGADIFSKDSVNRAFQLDSHEDNTTPYCFIEQHTFLDLDKDGYAEPYIVTIEEQSKKVVRIKARFTANNVRVAEDGKKIISIQATQYYTKFGFIPNPDGGFYDIGFGRLLGPLNESANTIINQLVDAGSLSNLQAGFIGKGLRIKMGESRFQPGEWKQVNATGGDLKQQIFPLPVREPSQVLFNLLDLLLKSGKELASVAEIFVGKMPGQNTPATTTMATIEQGMKVFTAVYKRIYRSLGKEFKKLYLLNREYMNPEEYIDVLDEPVQQLDYYGNENDIAPGADPTAVSSQEKQAKVQALMQLLQLGTINPMAVTQLFMEAHEIPNPQMYLAQPQPPQPDPKQQELQLKAQLETQKAQRDMQMAQAKMELERASTEQQMQMKERMLQADLQAKQLQAVLAAQQAQAATEAKAAETNQKLQQSAVSHQMSMHQQAQSHQMKLHQQKTLPKGNVKNGNKQK